MSSEINIKDFLIYSEESKSFLLWDVEKRLAHKLKSNSIKTTHAGSLSNGNGYYSVRFLGTEYKVHRLIYEMFHGDIPGGWIVDHIDGDKTNNNVINLRAVPAKLNARNSALRGNNKSGTNGVKLHYSTYKGKQYWSWRAFWTNLDGATESKFFSVSVLGDELAEHLAIEYRLHQIQLLNLSGAGYTERHGKNAINY